MKKKKVTKKDKLNRIIELLKEINRKLPTVVYHSISQKEPRYWIGSNGERIRAK